MNEKKFCRQWWWGLPGMLESGIIEEEVRKIMNEQKFCRQWWWGHRGMLESGIIEEKVRKIMNEQNFCRQWWWGLPGMLESGTIEKRVHRKMNQKMDQKEHPFAGIDGVSGVPKVAQQIERFKLNVHMKKCKRNCTRNRQAMGKRRVADSA
jgi:hypothetical protein